MPLNILLPIVVVGIVAIVVLIWVLNPTPRLVFRSKADVVEIWNRRNPNAEARSVVLNPDNSAALVTTRAGAGLVWSFGADAVTRPFQRSSECADTADGLVIKSHDFTAPKILIRLPRASDRVKWRAILEEST